MNNKNSFNPEISQKNLRFLNFIEDIYEISTICSTKTYVWGGFTIDIFEGKPLREHSDLDGFVVNMIDVLDEISVLYRKRGYETNFLEDIQMLQVEKGEIRGSFNCLEFNEEAAMWKHIGDDGVVYFPKNWLDTSPRVFCGKKVYTSGVKFEYAIKTKTNLLSPESERQLREKDRIAIQYLENVMKIEKIDKEDLYSKISSYNPYWIRKGFE